MRFFFFFKQKTAYEMRISDWSSDVCSSDLAVHVCLVDLDRTEQQLAVGRPLDVAPRLRGGRLAAALDRAVGVPDLERRAAVRHQRHAQVARVDRKSVV